LSKLLYDYACDTELTVSNKQKKEKTLLGEEVPGKGTTLLENGAVARKKPSK